MVSPSSSLTFALLHGGGAVAVGEYLFRVLAHLLAFGVVGLAVASVVRALEAFRSRSASTEDAES